MLAALPTASGFPFMSTIGGIDPSFKGQAVTGAEPPYARVADPSTLFEARARRFEAVAEGAEIGGYLTFLAQVCDAQARVAAATVLPLMGDVEQALAHGMPPLGRDLARDDGALGVLQALLGDLAASPLAEGPAAIVADLAASEDDEHRRMLVAVADSLFEIERLGESALVAAALQVWYALHAGQLDASRLRNIGETLCPACGGVPATSTIVGWPQAQSMRFLTCSLCQTMWNHVRVKCTACGSTTSVSYRQREGSSGDIAAEVCDSCRSYAKHINQVKNPLLDPIADDVASLGLDMLMREDGWKRAGLNPFLVLP